jgi:hypothetical protein
MYTAHMNRLLVLLLFLAAAGNVMSTPITGANLGGLLVLEPWMSTSSPATNVPLTGYNTEYQLVSGFRCS